MTFLMTSFEDLSPVELYRIMQLRSEVFVVEQNCIYLDLDGLDQEAFHVLGIINGKIHAYTRILKPGKVYPNCVAVGRVTTGREARGKGYARPLMEYTLDQCSELFPNYDVKISAQSYLLQFYHELEFQEVGDEYLEDGIPHIAMIRKYRNHLL